MHFCLFLQDRSYAGQITLVSDKTPTHTWSAQAKALLNPLWDTWMQHGIPLPTLQETHDATGTTRVYGEALVALTEPQASSALSAWARDQGYLLVAWPEALDEYWPAFLSWPLTDAERLELSFSLQAQASSAQLPALSNLLEETAQRFNNAHK